MFIHAVFNNSKSLKIAYKYSPYINIIIALLYLLSFEHTQFYPTLIFILIFYNAVYKVFPLKVYYYISIFSCLYPLAASIFPYFVNAHILLRTYLAILFAPKCSYRVHTNARRLLLYIYMCVMVNKRNSVGGRRYVNRILYPCMPRAYTQTNIIEHVRTDLYIY